jgi:hypothetical protein
VALRCTKWQFIAQFRQPAQYGAPYRLRFVGGKCGGVEPFPAVSMGASAHAGGGNIALGAGRVYVGRYPVDLYYCFDAVAAQCGAHRGWRGFGAVGPVWVDDRP